MWPLDYWPAAVIGPVSVVNYGVVADWYLVDSSLKASPFAQVVEDCL